MKHKNPCCQEYNIEYDKLLFNLRTIHDLVGQHADDQFNDELNYSYVGDLMNINKKLEEIVENLS